MTTAKIVRVFADGSVMLAGEARALKAATEKVANYTPEMTAKMVDMYVEQKLSPEAIAEAIGKSVKSIVAKLSREGVYKKKQYLNKAGEAAVKKDSFADYIGEALGLTEADADSLTKANKNALKMIADFIKAEKS